MSAFATLNVEKDCWRVEAAGVVHEPVVHESSNTVMIGPSPCAGRKGEYGIEVLADVGLFGGLSGPEWPLDGPADACLEDPADAGLAEGEAGLPDS